MNQLYAPVHPFADDVATIVAAQQGAMPVEIRLELENRLRAVAPGEVGWAILSLARLAASLHTAGHQDAAGAVLEIANSAAPELARETAMFQEEAARGRRADLEAATGQASADRAPMLGEAAPEKSIPASHLAPSIRRV